MLPPVYSRLPSLSCWWGSITPPQNPPPQPPLCSSLMCNTFGDDVLLCQHAPFLGPYKFLLLASQILLSYVCCMFRGDSLCVCHAVRLHIVCVANANMALTTNVGQGEFHVRSRGDRRWPTLSKCGAHLSWSLLFRSPIISKTLSGMQCRQAEMP